MANHYALAMCVVDVYLRDWCLRRARSHPYETEPVLGFATRYGSVRLQLAYKHRQHVLFWGLVRDWNVIMCIHAFAIGLCLGCAVSFYHIAASLCLMAFLLFLNLIELLYEGCKIEYIRVIVSSVHNHDVVLTFNIVDVIIAYLELLGLQNMWYNI